MRLIFHLLVLGLRWVCGCSHWVRDALRSRGFSDTNMLVSAMEPLVLGATPNAKPKRKWFCVAVEYRPDETHHLNYVLGRVCVYIHSSKLSYVHLNVSHSHPIERTPRFIYLYR